MTTQPHTQDVVQDSAQSEADTAVAEIEETTGAELSAEPDAATRPRKRGRWLGALRSRLLPLLLAVMLIASSALAAWLYIVEYRADLQTDTAAADVVQKAATDGTVALLSYSPESLDEDFTAAKSYLTGDFLSYYTRFTTQIVTPAAQQKSVKTEASVVQSAVSDLAPDSATVLVFINQTTTSNENPDGAFAASAVKVGLTKIDGSWLISTFDPV